MYFGTLSSYNNLSLSVVYFKLSFCSFGAQHIKVNDIEMSFNSLLNFYIYGILRRSEGVCSEINHSI